MPLRVHRADAALDAAAVVGRSAVPGGSWLFIFKTRSDAMMLRGAGTAQAMGMDPVLREHKAIDAVDQRLRRSFRDRFGAVPPPAGRPLTAVPGGPDWPGLYLLGCGVVHLTFGFTPM